VKRALLLTVAALAFVSSSASADPTRMLGFGTRGLAHAGAMLNIDDPIGAAINNPALLAMTGGKPQLGAGYLFARPKIDVNGQDANLLDIRGFSAGASIPFSYEDFSFGLGFAAHLPDQVLLRVHSVPATQPRAVMWDAPPHRLVANLAVGVRYKKLVAVGIGVSIFGKFVAEYLNFTIDATPGRTRTTASHDFAFPIIATPVASVVVTPNDWLRLSARYTGAAELSLSLPIVAQVKVPGTSVDGPIGLLFAGPSIFSPQEVALGASGVWKKLTLSAELLFQNWAAINEVSARIITNFDPDELGVEVPASDYVPTPPNYKNTFAPRIAAAYAMDIDVYTLVLRAGYAFIPTPVPPQRGVTNYGDSNRHVIGVGATFGFVWDWLKLPFEIDAGVQFQRIAPRTVEKDDPLSPGGDLSIVGMVYGLSAAGRVSW
jgi:long-subunit fatty acid transport protein